MTLTLGICGLPKSGKTTLFNALTGSQAATSAFATAGDEPNIAVVKVPDPRLDVLTAMFHPKKTTPAEVKYFDVGGLSQSEDPGAARTQGLSRQFIGAIAPADALVVVVRAFAGPAVPPPAGGVDPLRDLESVALELLFSDLGIIERRAQRLKAEISKMRGPERDARERELALLERLAPALEAGTPIRTAGVTADDEPLIRNYGFLSAKPWLVVLNLGESNLDAGPALTAAVRARWPDPGVAAVAVAAQLEMEIAQLPPADAAEFRDSLGLGPSPLPEVVTRSYDLLGLISFLTGGHDEVRAWTIRRGTLAPQAAGAIHSDLERGFIRAEVVPYDELVADGGLVEAKKHGHLRMEGKAYVVKDGDVLNILFNV